MAEAGTGVGKSFAYLLPAVHFALLNDDKQEKIPKQPVVISTATITLQRQLYEKDIPLVACAAGGAKIKAVIMKGRGNYICLRRLDETFREPPLFDFNSDEFKRIAQWANTSKTGDKSELPSVPSDTVWSSVCSESDLCMGLHCPWREQCFILALRKEAANAHIVVVNHHLLFADLAARYQGAGYENAVVLPPFSRLIIDEAHTIEKAATSFFSSEFTRTGIFRQLGRLFNPRRAKGLLVNLCSFLPPETDPIDDISDIIEKIRGSADELDERALQFCNTEGMFRLTPALDEEDLKAALFPCFKNLKKNINALTGMVSKLLGSLDEETANEPVVWEIKAILRRLEGIAEICAAFMDYRKHEDEVLWIERYRLSGDSSNERNAAVFTRSPLDLAPKLKDSVFLPNKTVVCVSATLAINDDFSWWASRCGIADANNRALLSGCFPSPFPYSSAVLLASPTDAPLPDEFAYQEYIDKAAGSLAATAGGSALILFTSYQSLKSAYHCAKKILEPLGIRCLKQGDDDRTRLLQEFLSDESSCLFATDSFWEGVDAPGDTLRMVIICRLPFRSPGDPVFEARCEAILKRGGSPFLELSLPQAAMKFKQGFGRLMRRSADRGVVIVLDSRLLKKNYGQLFIQSLPETKTSFNNLDKIILDVENFLF
ncbi:MAG: ATP-dependent DNA helicase DinG [Treponema sp.]|jgi:ATP-dependent DNA helicase DinG|nr:ATP-dependent DNA helicase DinG [Treponema sp.]